MWPILFNSSQLTIYSYPLFIGLSWGLAYRLGEERMALEKKSYSFWMIGLFISSWIGAKILFLITQNNWENSVLISSTNFWLGGGFVYLGGLAGGALFSVVFLRMKRLTFESLEFSIVPMLWAHSLGRIGCFLAGCCYGTTTELPWSIHLHGFDRHPVQLYESFSLAALAWGIGRFSKKHLIHYLVGYGSIRFLLEFFRDDEIRGVWILSTSQIISLVMVVLGGALYIKSQATIITQIKPK